MKTITIKHGCMGRYDDVSPFLVDGGALVLHFVLPRVSGEFYFVVWNSFDGGQNQQAIKIPATGDIELSGLRAGELHTEVKHYFRGELIEAFHIEPLIIKDVDRSVRAFPEIEALREQIEGLKETVIDLEKKNAEAVQGLQKTVHDLRAAFLAYSWAEYQSDIQLNGKSLSFEEFVVALGYDPEQFTEEEIEKIKAFKEEL